MEGAPGALGWTVVLRAALSDVNEVARTKEGDLLQNLWSQARFTSALDGLLKLRSRHLWLAGCQDHLKANDFG